jgi:hypothetical protein
LLAPIRLLRIMATSSGFDTPILICDSAGPQNSERKEDNEWITHRGTIIEDAESALQLVLDKQALSVLGNRSELGTWRLLSFYMRSPEERDQHPSGVIQSKRGSDPNPGPWKSLNGLGGRVSSR